MFKNNFKKIVLGDKGVILRYKNKKEKEILFSEIDTIYIQINKIQLIYIILFVAISILFVSLSLWFLEFELILISPIPLIILVVIKMNDYKRYVIKIVLKNGKYLLQPISLKSKYKTIDVIHKIRKELLKCKNI